MDAARVEQLVDPAQGPSSARRLSKSLDEAVARRVEFLTAYQDAAYAGRYRSMLERVREAEARLPASHGALAEAVARYYFKLLAYKDEYEVARLYTDGEFKKRVDEMFEGDYRMVFHLAPPLFAKRDPVTGELKKRSYGPWMFGAFGLLAKLKRLRGTPLDVFGYTAERRRERQLIADYEKLMDELLPNLSAAGYDTAVELASIPEQIRGFGHVKERHLAHAKKREADLLDAFRNPRPPSEPREHKRIDIAVVSG